MAESTASEPELVKKTRVSGRGDHVASRSRQLVGRRVRERVEARVGLERADLGGDGVGHLSPAMADVRSTRGWPCRRRRPARQRRTRAAPDPRTIEMKSSLAGRAKGCRNGLVAMGPLQQAASCRRQARQTWAVGVLQGQGGVVDRSLGGAQGLGHLGDGGLPVHPVGEASFQGGGDVAGRGPAGRRRTGDDDHVLASGRLGLDPFDRLAERAPPHLLVQLRELPGEDDGPVRPAGGGQVGERATDPVRRFVEHGRPGLRRDSGEPLRCARARFAARSPPSPTAAWVGRSRRERRWRRPVPAPRSPRGPRRGRLARGARPGRRCPVCRRP